MLIYTIIGLYLVAMLVLGVVFSKDNKNTSDFIRSGAKAEWWLAGTSMMVAGISAFTFTGSASAAYNAGPAMLIIYFSNVAGFFVGWLLLGAWFRQTRAINVPDIIRERFGPGAEQFFVIISLVTAPFAAAMQLWALGVFMHGIFQFSLIPTILVIGTVVTIYSLSGGRWAIMATDVIQGILVFAVTLVMAFLALKAIGGLAAFLELFKEPQFHDFARVFKEPGQFDNDRFTLQWAVGIFFMQIIVQVNLGTADRYLACKDGREAKMAGGLSCLLMLLGTIIWFIPPMVARLGFEQELLAMGYEEPSEASYAFMAIKLLPQALVGIVVVGMFAATMSSMDSGIAGQAGNLVRNLIPAVHRLFNRPPIAQHREVPLCRLMTLLVGFLVLAFAVLLATQKEVILFDVYYVFSSVIGIPIIFPMISVLFIRKLPKWSYFVIGGGCMVPSVYTLIDESFISKTVWSLQERGLLVILFGCAATLVCRLLYTKVSSREKGEIEAFYTRMHTPVDFTREIGEPDYGRQKKILGKSILAVAGILLLLLTTIANLGDAGILLFVITFVGSLGALLLFLGHRQTRTSLPVEKAQPAEITD